MAYDSRDVATTQIQKSQSTHTFHYERKKDFEPMFVLEAKGKTKSNHEALGLWQRSLRLHDVIDFSHNWPFISYGSGIIKIFLLPKDTPQSVA